MTTVALVLQLECRDDVPDHVVEWMADHLTDYATSEFSDDYNAASVSPAYDGPPLIGEITILAGLHDCNVEIIKVVHEAVH